MKTSLQGFLLSTVAVLIPSSGLPPDDVEEGKLHRFPVAAIPAQPHIIPVGQQYHRFQVSASHGHLYCANLDKTDNYLCIIPGTAKCILAA